MIQTLKEFLLQNSWKKKPIFKAPLRPYTSFGCKGETSCLLKVSTKKELQKIISFSLLQKIPYLILGKGSNSIFTDEGFKGILILLDGDFKKITLLKNHQVLAGAGVSSTGLAARVTKESLGGAEFLLGIPASVGGLVFMNAGANRKECQEIICKLELLEVDKNNQTKIILKEKNQFSFAYRYSSFMEKKNNKKIITQALFQFFPHKKEQILKKQKEILQKRKDTQPIHAATWGSVFQNPNNYYAADLIEKCGFKGKVFGGLQVSSKHSNFFENKASACFDDISNAILQIQEKVWNIYQVFLKPEVRIFSEKGEVIEKFYQNNFSPQTQ